MICLIPVVNTLYECVHSLSELFFFFHRDAAVHNEKDEDTDGISIISDSDPESTTPCELTFDKCLLEEDRPTDPEIPEYVSINPPHPTNNRNEDQESVRGDDDFLGDNTGKLKTYVHRRNKRLSTVLNIIVLGSVITAAGVAIGHMWGAKNECSMHATPSVNKILSNLYKLQEENAYLRNKLKELTFINNIHMQHRKAGTEKLPLRQKCRKVFEEPLTNRNVDKITKCVDNEIMPGKMLDIRTIEYEYEKDFLSDIDKLKNVYQQNKSWLDEEIAKRVKNEEQYLKKMKNNLKSPKSIRLNEGKKSLYNESLKKQSEIMNELPSSTEKVINVTDPLTHSISNVYEHNIVKDIIPEKRVSYADSLKSGHKVVKRSIQKEESFNKTKALIKKRKPKEFDTISENSMSEEELRKDDRYVGNKYKIVRKKSDRQKIHKKQKRKNKYEQWEMKGGYMKDYDDFSITSGQDIDYALKNHDKNFLSREFERNNYVGQFSETDENSKSTEADSDHKSKLEKSETRASKRNKLKGKNKDKEVNWYETRAAVRNEARKKLEQELFGDSTPNNAGWYFRRMQRREQCRIKGDNSTYKRLSKRIMNYKTKH